ncbi:nuclear factor erythroid 2-related factor 1 [Arapaima gigas]
MLYLKKYFTEGLIQFTILLSLIGVRVDVDTYLSSQFPPLREIILGPSSAYTQTQFHNLRNTLDGYGIHPKSVDLDYFFASRRLLNQVRSLDHLRVPTTELSTWLVHRDPESVVSAAGQSSSSIALDNGASLEDVSNPEGSAMRGGGTSVDGLPESGYSLNGEETLGAVAPQDSQDQGSHLEDCNDDLTKEDIDLIDILWRQDIDLGAGREVFDYSSRQKENEVDKCPLPEQNEQGVDGQESWRNGVNRQGRQSHTQVDGETGESIPEELADLGAQTSLSLQECLRLLEATFPFGDESEFPDTVSPELREPSSEEPSTSQGLLSPLLPQSEPSLDLEQQWQDIMAIMELQDMEVNSTADSSFLSDSTGGTNNSGMEPNPLVTFGLPSPTPINQDVSLHQATLPSCSQEFSTLFGPELDPRTSMETSGSQQPTLHSNSSNINSTFGGTNLTGLFLPPLLNGTSNSTCTPMLQDPLNSLLEEAMLDEISLLDLAMEEGFSQAQAFQLEDELDSDSGLSLDSSQSPASPSSSETSCSSSSSSSSSSTCATFSEEGAVGYSTDSEPVLEQEEGAVGGYQPEYSKFCRMSYQDLSQFQHLPQLENISHNHTYNLPLSSSSDNEHLKPLNTGKKPGRDKQQQAKVQPSQDFLEKQSSRDERRARAMKIPFSNDKIINLPVEEFNELLAKHHLSEAQLALIRDIRRRGKNKMAAQNCRKRKLDTILNLEQDVEELRRNKTRLLKEKMEYVRSIRQMKQKVHSLYHEVLNQLRDEDGRPYPASEYSLQYGPDGSVLVMPRSLVPEQTRKADKKQKDKKK